MTPTVVSKTTAKIACLCGAISEPGTLLDAEQFPVPTTICVCSTCRATTGTFGALAVPLKSAPSTTSLKACDNYSASAACSRYFCGRCGSKVFFSHQDDGRWFTSAGSIDRHDDQKGSIDTCSLTESIYTSSATRDGGMVGRMVQNADWASQEMKCYSKDRDGEPVKLSEAPKLWRAPSTDTTEATQAQSTSVDLSCHCEGIKLKLLPASAHAGNAGSDLLNRWTRGIGKDRKWVAKLCVCRSDRLTFGTPMMAWTYLFPECIQTPDGEAVPFPRDQSSYNSTDLSEVSCLRTLKIYHSSEGVKRSFCGRCGASIFFEHVNRVKDEPYIIDVAPGLIRSDSGALAENLLSWDWEWVSWPGENENRAWLDTLTGGRTLLRK